MLKERSGSFVKASLGNTQLKESEGSPITEPGAEQRSALSWVLAAQFRASGGPEDSEGKSSK